MFRTNEQWLGDLRSSDIGTADAAMVDLQDRLRRSIFAKFLDEGLTGHCIEDVVQEATVRILQRLDKFRGESKFLTWCTSFSIRTGLEMIRRGFWSARTTGDFSTDELKVDLASMWKDQGIGPQQSAERKEILELLSRAINEVLTERQRHALMHEVRGKSVESIASEMGTSRGAIYKLTHDARKKLKQELEQAGIEEELTRTLFYW